VRSPSAATFFPTPAAFRRWLRRHHASAEELWVGYYKKATGRPSITWPESVDEALCFGWIDGIRKSIDDQAYMIRFTPRRSGSNWSAVNLKRVEVLIAEGRMAASGVAAYEARDPVKSPAYSFENGRARLSRAQEREFRQDPDAWAFWKAQPPGYRKQATWWVVSAKREGTRARRLATLIEDSARGLSIKPLRRP
jgi:uncharacterized protein YdeI (YjbR/CyaY-like superfamily)